MTELKTVAIQNVLHQAQALLGWDGYVYSFTVGLNWTAAVAFYVRAASHAMLHLLDDYPVQIIQNNHHRLSLVSNDLSQAFLVSEFPNSPLDRKLAWLITGQGWHSGMAFPAARRLPCSFS